MFSEIAWGDPNYPALLKEIHDPPRHLWVQGDCDFLGPLVAVVGARECTRYGEKIAYELSRALAKAGVTVVSGLAYGIDTAAHRGALDGGGKTIAVLGCGIDVGYPSRNQGLKAKIAASGAVLSEFAPGTVAAPWTFPKRNRIVSGLSRGVLVIEAGVKSGSLITADFALQQGRDVFAVPGPITAPQSEGTNRLIQNGAKLVLTVNDVLDEWGASAQLPLTDRTVARNEATRNEDEADDGDEPEDVRRVLKILGKGSRHVDDLIAASGVSAGKMSAVLVELEIRGKIGALPGGFFERKGH